MSDTSAPSSSETPVTASASTRACRWTISLPRRLYDWVLGWADTPYGTPALFVLSFAESSFFPVPPDVLQIALSVARPKRSFFYAAVSTVASVSGGILGFVIGYALWSAAVQSFFFNYVPGVNADSFAVVSKAYHDNAFWAITGAGFTPIPYKVFTIAAGVFEVSLPILIAASILGRSGRFFLVGACVYFFGPRVKHVLERYFNLATLAFFILLVGGFLVVKYVMH